MLRLLVAIGFFKDPGNLEAWERKGDIICVMSQEYFEQAVVASDMIYLDGVPDETTRDFIPVYKYCIYDIYETSSQPPSSEIAKK